MCKLEKATLLILLTSLWFTPATRAQSNTDVVVAFSATNATPFHQGFAGFCTEMLTGAVEYSDTNLQQITATLSPGWLRYNVQVSTNLATWATLDRVSNAQTNFTFTDLNTAKSGFYRLVVP